MTTITIKNNTGLSKTNFLNLKDLYSFMLDNQLVTEIWFLNIYNLSDSSKKLLLKSQKWSDLINI